VEVAMIAIKLALILVKSMGDRVPTVVYLFFVCVAAFVYVYIYFLYLPYYRQHLNQLQVGCASVFAWASICVSLAYFRKSPTVPEFVRCISWRRTNRCLFAA
jgi:hypothetical protein